MVTYYPLHTMTVSKCTVSILAGVCTCTSHLAPALSDDSSGLTDFTQCCNWKPSKTVSSKAYQLFHMSKLIKLWTAFQTTSII